MLPVVADFSDRLAAEMADVICDLVSLQLVAVIPPETGRFPFVEEHLSGTADHSKVNEIDMLVSWFDILKEDAGGLRQNDDASEGFPAPQKLYLEPGLFTYFPNSSLFGKLVFRYVTSRGKPCLHLVVPQ